MKIICIGRNYIEHAKELNNPVPEKPVFFLKPETALLLNNRPLKYPAFTSDLHYETELVLKICKKGHSLSEAQSKELVQEIGLGIDFTARDLQTRCKEKGLPWEIAKSFDHSAPVSKKFLFMKELPDAKHIRFELKLNGRTVQKGDSADMIFSFPRIISYVSHFITLLPGDLVFTGTPEGVGPVKPGDRLEAFLESRKMLTCSVK